MGLRCSLLGHEWGQSEIEREEETRGSERVITVREFETCTRCGEFNLISENTGVTSALDADGSTADADAAEAESDDAADGQLTEPVDDTDTTAGTTGDAGASGDHGEQPPRTPPTGTDDAEILDGSTDDGIAPDAGSTPNEPPSSPTDAADPPARAPADDAGSDDRDEESAEDADDGARILDPGSDEDPLDAATELAGHDAGTDSGTTATPTAPDADRDDGPSGTAFDGPDAREGPPDSSVAEPGARDHGEWPAAEDTGPPAEREGTVPDWPNDPDEGGADGPDAEVVGDSDRGPERADAESVADSTETAAGDTRESADPRADTPAAAESAAIGTSAGETPRTAWVKQRDDDAEPTDAHVSPSDDAEFIEETVDRNPAATTTVEDEAATAFTSADRPEADRTPEPTVETELLCPECEHATASRSSLRAGDICPECRRGYLNERTS